MATLVTKTLIIAASLLLGACSGGSSDTVTTEDAMSKIPEDFRIFDGYTKAMDKAKSIGGTMEERAEAQRKILEQI